MNLIAVRKTQDGYAIDYPVQTEQGEQIWTSFVGKDDPRVAEWIAEGNVAEEAA